MEQIPFDLPVRSAQAREDFFVGPENEEALVWLDRWPDWPAPVVVLTGPVASGKSHLAAVWSDRAGAVSFSPSELAVCGAEDLLRRGNVLVCDAVDRWIGDAAAETTLFHLYNMLKERGGSLLLTSCVVPSALEFAVADVASRLRAAPVAAIYPPGDEVLSAVLVKQFYDRQLKVGADVVRYVLPRMERSFQAVRDLVARADALALAQKRPISIPLMRDIL